MGKIGNPEAHFSSSRNFVDFSRENEFYRGRDLILQRKHANVPFEGVGPLAGPRIGDVWMSNEL